jgi:THUMP domain-like/Protein-L-isoaspartate(D-aspartate) O-methyltransferase (PCMT)
MIHLHQSDDPAVFAMQFHGGKDLPVRAMAEQIGCRQKAVKKLPELSRYNLLYTPLALEQSSGERTAEYKSAIMSGKRVIDLSGGLGVDTMFLARVFGEVVYCERDQVLCAVVEHNLKQCGISNVEVKCGDSIELLSSYLDDSFDWIFVDPARREQGRRSIVLDAASPDVVACHDMMLGKAKRVCIKASPALEISGLKKLLPALLTIVVVSVDRECKEMLLLLDRGGREKAVTVKAVCLSSDSEAVTEIAGDGVVDRPLAASVKGHFYEPDPAIIKARLSSVLARTSGLEFVNNRVDYLTSEGKREGFPGRSFRVIEVVPYKPKSFRGFLGRHAITGASIQRRDFPLSPEELRKKYRLLESERAFLFFTRDGEGHPICIYALRCFPGDEAALAGQCRSADPEC